MDIDQLDDITLNQYRSLEVKLHLELMKTISNYITELGIVSILGILNVVKQETIELERATKREFKDEDNEEPNTDNVNSIRDKIDRNF